MAHSCTFSIIIPHYQPSVAHKDFLRCVQSVKAQTCDDYEVIIYHDGPPRDMKLLKESPFRVVCTPWRYNDFGHSLRDLGIKKAKGEYIIHLNADSILYPTALEQIKAKIEESLFSPSQRRGLTAWGVYKFITNNHIVIFPIFLLGVHCVGVCLVPLTGRQKHRALPDSEDYTHKYKHLLTGYPAKLHCIDAMQFVMKTSVWRKEGGWYDKGEKSDGKMYPKFVEKYGARYIHEPLGEHYP